MKSKKDLVDWSPWTPKLFQTIRGYRASDFTADLTSGLTVGLELLLGLAIALLLTAVVAMLPLANLPMLGRGLLTLAIVVPLGPMLYRVAFQPIAEASVLVLLIVSVALHLLMVGLGLLIFGPEGSRTLPFSEAQLELGSIMLSGHTLAVWLVALILIGGLFAFFRQTLAGKALLATAILIPVLYRLFLG